MATQPHLLLVVDDHLMTLNVLRGLFVRRGWRVETAAKVEEAIWLLENRPEPEWLFLDLMLPDGRGEAVLEHVKNRGLKTKVLVMTGTYDPPRLQHVAELDPEAIVQKPVDLDGIFQMCEPPEKP